ncbi:MAG: lysophospholipid acyltransferase family protein [Acidobacteria bacterium]|nr:lysophospholipid acyltransferase family protein [Acidobacteriota bacterium]
MEEDVLSVLRMALIGLLTAVLGSVAIAVCFVPGGGRGFMTLVRLWSAAVLRICRVRHAVSRHPDIDPSRAAVYVANHQSHLDIPALVLSMPTDFRVVAKKELLYIPIFGWALWLARFPFIDRASRERAIRTLDKAARLLRTGTSLVIFPEGTRSPDGRLLPFKKGGFILALQAGVPIVPVSIRGGGEVLPKGSLRLRPGCIEVIFGAPVSTSDYTMETKEHLIDEVRLRILTGLTD